MSLRSWSRLRRLAAGRGFTPARWVPAASEGRADEATIRPARLLEDLPLTGHAVGDPEPWPGAVAFLDGTQRYEVMAYAGASPVVVAEVAAAVLERRDRRLRVVQVARRRLLLGRAEALRALEDIAEGAEPVPLPDDAPPHPVHDVQLARREIDRARGRLEVETGHAYRAGADAWLVVDGGLTESPRWAADPRMVGVCKSHATLPFGGRELEQYLRLPAGSRSPLFAPPGHDVAPVYSWALRLWPWEGRDLLHGLIRVEVAASPAALAQADAVSRWLLAERAPASLPDPRWDRLLYGIRAVEEYLRASTGG